MDKDYIISIQDLLKGWNRNSEFDNANESRIKLVRHYKSDVLSDSFIYNKYKGSVYKLYRTDYALFKEWQSEQQDRNMKNVDYLVGFLAEEGCECRFIGVYRNYGPKRATGNGLSEYAIEEVEGFEGLKDKVVIDWGKGRNCMQNWQSTKNVRRIDQVNTGNDIPYFIRYEDVILSFSQLQKVVEDKEWKSKLESLNCVYMILDKETGKQYVGVTYKDMKPGIKNGILGRWTEYAKTGHGNNKLLVALLAEKGISYADQNFQWTILETLPLNVTPKVAIDRESLYKKKFGTREHGYNEN